MKKVLSIILVLLVLCVLIPTSVLADGGDVYVSSTGSDENSGTAEAPYATLEKALEAVPDNGTIHVVGTVAPTATDCTRRGRTITITGGTLDMTGISYLVLGDVVTFRDITLVGPTAESAEVRIYANGYKLVMDTGITTSGKVELFGGGRWRKVDKTDVTVLSGTYRAIYGGGNGSTNGTAGSSLVKGDVNLYVGGDTNADANPKSHSFESGWVIFGGGRYGHLPGGF